MVIYPAIDLLEGKVVRLERGDYGKCKVYSNHPEEIAAQWVSEGARWLHVVDLEGAREGSVKNWQALEKILSLKGIHVQFGGGVRTKQDIEKLLRLGVSRVILGSKVMDPSFLEDVTESFGERIALSLDIRGEEIQIEGWLKGMGKSIFDFLSELKPYRVGCLVVTDIDRDGTLAGINLTKIKRLLEASSFRMILSGGVQALEDLRSLVSLQMDCLDGVIIGKALYEKRLALAEAVRLAGQSKNLSRGST